MAEEQDNQAPMDAQDSDMMTPDVAAVQTADQAEVTTDQTVSDDDQATVDADQPEEQPEQPEQPPFTWQASEYVHHHKGVSWYMGLALLLAVLLGVAIIFKLWLSMGVFVAMGLAIAVYARKPPRLLDYSLSSSGIDISGKDYPYENFRSFSVITDVSWHTIDLEPTQRFMPRLSILFGDDNFDEIVAHLAQYLPRTDREPDFVERASRYFRF